MENLRKMFAEAAEKRKPLIEERDKLRAELDSLTQNDHVNELRNRLKEINGELGPIEDEYAALARALGPKASIPIESGTYTKTEGKSK